MSKHNYSEDKSTKMREDDKANMIMALKDEAPSTIRLNHQKKKKKPKAESSK